MYAVTLAAVAQANTYTLQPGDADLGDLDHYKAYRWRINWAVPSDEVIVGATLFFDNIRNWDNNTNILHLSLLNRSSGTAGTDIYTDNQAVSDYFSTYASFVPIGYLSGFNTTARDVTFDLGGSVSQTLNQGTIYSAGNLLSVLNNYASDGRFAIGFDPDCHYWNDGVTLKIETRTISVPDSGMTLILLGSVFLGLATIRRKLCHR